MEYVLIGYFGTLASVITVALVLINENLAALVRIMKAMDDRRKGA